jgi:hypothetical protein
MNSDLTQRLLQSAQTFAQRATEDERSAEFAVHLGAALEHLLKAALANRHPALLLTMSGKTSAAAILAIVEADFETSTRPKTVGPDEAFSRCVEILGGSLGSHRIDFERIVEARNDAAHLAGAPTQHDELLDGFASMSQELLPHLGCTNEQFWGPYWPRVTDRLASLAALIANQVATKLSATGHAESARPNMSFGSSILKHCPRCGADARLWGHYSFYEETIEYNGGDDEHDGEMREHRGVMKTFYPKMLRCEHCALVLEGVELRVVKMDAGESKWAEDWEASEFCLDPADMNETHWRQEGLRAAIRDIDRQ